MIVNDDLTRYVELHNKELKENGGEHFLNEEMIDLRAKMMKEVLVRGNAAMLVSAHYKDGRQIDISCGVGWFKPIGDFLDKVAMEWNAMEFKDYRFRVTCIKEKFGKLRVYYGIHHKSGNLNDEYDQETMAAVPALRKVVGDHMQVLSLLTQNMCEDCGRRGHIRGGMWIQTLCDEHAALKKKPEMDEFLKSYLDPEEQKGIGDDELRIRGDGGQEDRP